MIKRAYQSILKNVFSLFLTLLLLLSFASVVYAGEYEENVNNEGYDQNTSLDVHRERLSFDALLKWTPESDPDAKYNRATVPLKTGRFYGPQVNPNATPNAKIQHWAMISTCGAQGSLSYGNYAFTHWQYLDTLVGWAETKGTIVCPTADVVDAAHRNGVPVTAGIFFGGGYNTYGQSQIRLLTKKEGNRYPVIDKLAQLAKFYGFDGYSFNQETNGASSYLNGMFEAMRYARLNYPKLIFNWYDSMTSTYGNVNWQDGLTNQNKKWIAEDSELKEKGALKPYLMDDMFTNYNWNASKVNESVRIAKEINRSPYDVYHAFEMQARGFREKYRFPFVLDNDGKLKTSLGLYCADASTMGAEFHDKENYLWSSKKTEDDGSVTYDPRQRGDDEWGLANYVLDKSVVNTLPFNSTFNTGHGYSTYIDGNVAHSSEWFNRGLSSIAPTWTWIVDTDATKTLKADYDFTTVFNGGSSVKYWGKLENNKYYDAKLYSTRLNANKDITFRITVKASEASNVYGLISRGKAAYNWNEQITLTKVATKNGWDILEGTIPAGEMINGIGIRIKATNNVDNFTFNLGQMQLYNKKVSMRRASAPRLNKLMHFDNYAEARVESKKIKNAEFYELWLEYGSTKKLLKVSPNPNMFVHKIELPRGVTKAKLSIVPIDNNGNRRPELASDSTLFNFKGRYASVYTPGENLMRKAELVTWISRDSGMNPRCIIDGIYSWDPRISTKDSDIWACFDLGEVKQIGMARIIAMGNIGSSEHGRHVNTLDNEDINPLEYEIYYSNTKPATSGRLPSLDGIPSDAQLCAKVRHSATAGEVCIKTGNYSDLNNITYHTVTGRYVYLRIFNIPRTHSHWNLRLCEFELFSNLGLPKTATIDPSDITVERVSTNSGNVTFKNVPFNSTINLYNEEDVLIATKKQSVFEPYSEALYSAYRNKTLVHSADIKFENVTMKKTNGFYRYEIKNTLLESSSRVEIPYTGEDAEMTPDIDAGQLQFSPYKVSTIYKRNRKDGQVYSLTISGLAPGTVVQLKQTGLYRRLETVIADENGVAFFDWVFVDKNRKIKLIAQGVNQQIWNAEKEFNVS